MAHFGSIWSLLAKEVCKYLVKVFQAMASTKFYLDHRNVADGCECPLKIAIYSTGRSALINLGIKLLPKQWDNKRNRVINHPQSKALNLWLCHRKQQIDLFICEYCCPVKLRRTQNICPKSLKTRLRTFFFKK